MKTEDGYIIFSKIQFIENQIIIAEYFSITLPDAIIKFGGQVMKNSVTISCCY